MSLLIDASRKAFGTARALLLAHGCVSEQRLSELTTLLEELREATNTIQQHRELEKVGVFAQALDALSEMVAQLIDGCKLDETMRTLWHDVHKASQGGFPAGSLRGRVSLTRSCDAPSDQGASSDGSKETNWHTAEIEGNQALASAELELEARRNELSQRQGEAHTGRPDLDSYEVARATYAVRQAEKRLQDEQKAKQERKAFFDALKPGSAQELFERRAESTSKVEESHTAEACCRLAEAHARAIETAAHAQYATSAEALEAASWAAKIDPRSGRTYFFHPKSNTTQWHAPAIDVPIDPNANKLHVASTTGGRCTKDGEATTLSEDQLIRQEGIVQLTPEAIAFVTDGALLAWTGTLEWMMGCLDRCPVLGPASATLQDRPERTGGKDCNDESCWVGAADKATAPFFDATLLPDLWLRLGGGMSADIAAFSQCSSIELSTVRPFLGRWPRFDDNLSYAHRLKAFKTITALKSDFSNAFGAVPLEHYMRGLDTACHELSMVRIPELPMMLKCEVDNIRDTHNEHITLAVKRLSEAMLSELTTVTAPLKTTFQLAEDLAGAGRSFSSSNPPISRKSSELLPGRDSVHLSSRIRELAVTQLFRLVEALAQPLPPTPEPPSEGSQDNISARSRTTASGQRAEVHRRRLASRLRAELSRAAFDPRCELAVLSLFRMMPSSTPFSAEGAEGAQEGGAQAGEPFCVPLRTSYEDYDDFMEDERQSTEEGARADEGSLPFDSMPQISMARLLLRPSLDLPGPPSHAAPVHLPTLVAGNTGVRVAGNANHDEKEDAAGNMNEPLTDVPVRVLVPQLHDDQRTPALVVASGTSADEEIAALKRHVAELASELQGLKSKSSMSAQEKNINRKDNVDEAGKMHGLRLEFPAAQDGMKHDRDMEVDDAAVQVQKGDRLNIADSMLKNAAEPSSSSSIPPPSPPPSPPSSGYIMGAAGMHSSGTTIARMMPPPLPPPPPGTRHLFGAVIAAPVRTMSRTSSKCNVGSSGANASAEIGSGAHRTAPPPPPNVRTLTRCSSSTAVATKPTKPSALLVGKPSMDASSCDSAKSGQTRPRRVGIGYSPPPPLPPENYLRSQSSSKAHLRNCMTGVASQPPQLLHNVSSFGVPQLTGPLGTKIVELVGKLLGGSRPDGRTPNATAGAGARDGAQKLQQIFADLHSEKERLPNGLFDELMHVERRLERRRLFEEACIALKHLLEQEAVDVFLHAHLRGPANVIPARTATIAQLLDTMPHAAFSPHHVLIAGCLPSINGRIHSQTS